MFNDVDEMAAEIEKFKNNIAGVDSIAENLKKVHFKLMAQSKKTDELIEAVVKTQADTTQALKDEISKVSQIVNALTEKVEYLCNKQQKDHTLIIVGVILVAIASVTSIVGLFI